MARTPINAFGRLSMHYDSHGKPHVFRVYVPSFGTDPAVGTFTTPSTPASLDALATELTTVIKPLYQTDSGLSWGDWIGELHTTGESFIPINNGTITQGSASFQTNIANQPGPVSQATWTFRDSTSAKIRMVNVGAQYVGNTVFRYGGLGGAFLAFANYILGSSVIISRSNLAIASMVSLTFDTNDGLTRRYRR